jgi:hypothetical protein
MASHAKKHGIHESHNGWKIMAQKTRHEEVDLSESSVYGKDTDAELQNTRPEDIATEATLDRLEAITGGADDEPGIYEGRLGREVEKLDASTDEEIDALRVNLSQTDERANARDGSGRVIDDVAEERLAEFTEVGPDLDEEGALSVAPGNEDTSAAIRRHHPNTEVARAEAVVEGNLDEPRDEERVERETDEGTGA